MMLKSDYKRSEAPSAKRKYPGGHDLEDHAGRAQASKIAVLGQEGRAGEGATDDESLSLARKLERKELDCQVRR